jgi:hypothetical protein
VDGRKKELIAVGELYKEAEWLSGGGGMGDERKLQMGCDLGTSMVNHGLDKFTK